MATPHNAAGRGDIAPTVLMPGDPLRAEFIANTFLEAPVCFNKVRGMLGFTGSYKGKKVSVMGSGMGMPSIGIYSWELFTQYGVERIIRIGSAGAYDAVLQLYDVVLASAAWSESSYARTQNGYEADTTYPSAVLNDRLRASAHKAGVPLVERVVHSSDVFYRTIPEVNNLPYWQRLRDEKGCAVVEMESFALFHNAAVCGKEAACLLTVSDSFTQHEETTAEERERCFTEMMHIALEVV